LEFPALPITPLTLCGRSIFWHRDFRNDGKFRVHDFPRRIIGISNFESFGIVVNLRTLIDFAVRRIGTNLPAKWRATRVLQIRSDSRLVPSRHLSNKKRTRIPNPRGQGWEKQRKDNDYSAGLH
jgi:hypothetical protein